MTDSRIVLDTGALDRVTTDRTIRRAVDRLLQAGWSAHVPTVVLAEAITGRATDARVNQTLRRTGTTLTTAPTARLAGRLRGNVARAGRESPSGIDALVAAHAAEATRAVVFTTDPSDLRALLTDHTRAVVRAV